MTGNTTQTRSRVKTITFVALMTAVVCVLGPLSIPLPGDLVPVSLGALGVLLATVLLGCIKGTVSVLLYLLIGFIGVPVFAGFTGGAGKLFGPTGGYLIGYIFMALIVGFFCDRSRSLSGAKRKLFIIAGGIIGTAVLYLFGSAWLAGFANMTLPAALLAGAVPFIPADLVKIAIAAFLGDTLYIRLNNAGLIN